MTGRDLRQVKGGILNRLLDGRIFGLSFIVSGDDAGNFVIFEACDDYFAQVLTRADLRALGEELIKASESET